MKTLHICIPFDICLSCYLLQYIEIFEANFNERFRLLPQCADFFCPTYTDKLISTLIHRFLADA